MRTIDILAEALAARGYQSRMVTLGMGKEFMQVLDASGEPCLMLSANGPLYPFATASARLLSKDKSTAYDLAGQMGVSIPRSVYVRKEDTEYEAALQLLRKYGLAIAKPLDSALSNGLTLNIHSEQGMRQAIAYARKYSDNVIVQQQISGDEIRFPVINGKVAAAVMRRTPRVVGDGLSTLAQLIEIENEQRAKLVNVKVSYPRLDEKLVPKALLESQDVPAQDEIIELNRGTMIANGASVYNIISELHPSYIQIVEKLAKPLGKGFVVVDIVVADYTRPATDNNYWFLEFNIAPAIVLFYSCRDGKHFRVAQEYLAPMIEGVIQ